MTDVADWYTRIALGAPSAEEQRAFEEWLAADVRHGREYEGYCALWNSLGPQGTDPRIALLRSEALTRTAPRRSLSGRHMTWAAAAVVLVAVGVWFVLRPGLHAGTFVTAVGERSTVTLEDGSSVVLNTDSAVETRYGAGERAVKLIRGQALFDVAKQPSRPFVVYAGDRRIVALGTSFDVRLRGSGVHVTLVEGRVAVSRIGDSGSPGLKQTSRAEAQNLLPGQQLIVAGEVSEVRSADVAAVTGWQEGRLIFNGEALADAVAEVNRYSRTRIVLADVGLNTLRVSGVFRSGQTTGFVAALEVRFPVEIQKQTEDEIVLRMRNVD